MTNRERMAAVLEGNRPDRIPFAIYGGYIHDENYREWQPLIEQGLCQMPRLTVIRETALNVEEIISKEIDADSGYMVERHTLRTPVGELTQIRHNGWNREFFVKTREDYKIMRYIIEHTSLEADFSACPLSEDRIGDTGVTIIRAERSPLQKIIVDFAGLENYSYHLYDFPAEMQNLIEALTDLYTKYYELLTACPIKYIQIPENLTSQQTGPQRYKKYIMPFYDKIIPMLHDAGKKVFVHYDGKFACLIDLIVQTELDGLESFTPPPEGDISYKDARAALPDKFFMAHIGLSDYALPPEALKTKFIQFIKDASPDGRNLLFEISENLPANWKQMFPFLLNILEEHIWVDDVISDPKGRDH